MNFPKLFTCHSSLVTSPAGRLSLFAAFALAAASANADISITDITARQRWPWNGLVDIDFTITGAAAGDAFAIDIDATAASGATSLSAKTYVAEPVAGAGANRVVWDLGADYPEFRANDLLVSVTATPLSDSTPIYMVIDLSGGADAAKYPVRYTTQPPAHVQGAADEPCQTTELWMKRIDPVPIAFRVNTFYTAAASNNGYFGKITEPYYIGVFELTQKQYNLITGEWPAFYSNVTCRASRPLEYVPYNTFTGTGADCDASPSSITAASPLGKLRAKTSLPLNLPTDIQWEYACRGGTKLDSGGEFYRYYVNGSQAAMDSIARYSGNVASGSTGDSDTTYATATVGSYLPNGYGLYDMIGNVRECLSAYGLASGSSYRAYYQEQSGDDTLGMTAGNPIVDPKGTPLSLAPSSNSIYRRTRGGSYATSGNPGIWTAENWESSIGYAGAQGQSKHTGYRLSMTVE